MNKHWHWSKKEVSDLRKYYPILRVKDLAKIFPKRTKGTIVAKAMSLELPSAKLWQPKENKILKKYFCKLRVEELLKLLPRRSKTAIWAQGERLGLKQNRNYSRLAVNGNYFKKWSSNMAYILGYILSDGCIGEGTYKGYSDALKFGVQKKDTDILEKIKKELSSDHKISLCEVASHLTITNQTIVDDLKKLGIKYRKSLRENVPNVPEKYIRDFIRGVIDGDGSIHFDKRNYPTLSVCGGKNTITFIQSHFLSKFNIYSKITKIKKNERCQFLFYIAYRANSAKTLIKYLYDNAELYLDRKYKLAQRASNVKMKIRKNYTNEEKQIICKFYKSLPANKILPLLPNRKWSAIQQEARALKIHKYNIINKK
jgi:hypothetical protein